MLKRRNNSTESIEVGGFQFKWTLRRNPKWSTDQGYIGAAISVERVDATRRELIVEYSFPGFKRNGMLERTKLTSRDVAAAVREAIAAGWDPDSRGRPFVFQIASDK
jgi:hypothetical protein